MGQQQVLLIVLSVILVGIAISVGITLFRSYSVTASQDAIIMDIMNLGSTAYQYRIRPRSMGGGGGDYDGFEDHFAQLPEGFRDNDNAEYSVEIVDGDNNHNIVITGESKTKPGAKIIITYNSQLQMVGDIVKEGWD